ADRVRELVELRSSLGHLLRRLGERLGAACSHLYLRRDQLPDDVLLERRPLRRSLQLLEAVAQLERLAVEDRGLLLHRDREVRAALVRLEGGTDLLVRRQLLCVAHGAPTLLAPRDVPRRSP